MARMCCSNCDVTAPSIVQWPLLWTRGAISLTSGPRLAREEFDGEHADVAERLGDPQRRDARLGDLPATGVAAGTVERCRMPSRCAFSGESQKAWRPSAQRATMTENSAAKSTPASATAGCLADRLPSGLGVAVRADPGLALAVVAEAAGLEHDGQAELGDRGADVVERVDPPPRRRRGRRSLR